ncbi:hypothetical protein VFPPC_17563 [Pochonia chlamydosporia 170]|uniref:Uncharacterized protein n=1 Tax=Pochonia chlamydosporia 170 TaxID=1380566 RepID=A0A219ASK7_METCM|nr:hypothetical protein VFPPC_17563 [Pochonia chlamydosporia 170]OWT43274.1 hypothetical protein VFPPC_17563 [Pochonia chlamydosporia 170]
MPAQSKHPLKTFNIQHPVPSCEPTTHRLRPSLNSLAAGRGEIESNQIKSNRIEFSLILHYSSPALRSNVAQGRGGSAPANNNIEQQK